MIKSTGLEFKRLKYLPMLNSWNLIMVLWLPKRISLFLGNTHWAIKKLKGMQQTLQWFTKTNNNVSLCHKSNMAKCLKIDKHG